MALTLDWSKWKAGLNTRSKFDVTRSKPWPEVREVIIWGIRQDFSISSREIHPAESQIWDYFFHLTMKWGKFDWECGKARATGNLELCCLQMLSMHSDHGRHLQRAEKRGRTNSSCNLGGTWKSLQGQWFLRGIFHETGTQPGCDKDEIPE